VLSRVVAVEDAAQADPPRGGDEPRVVGDGLHRAVLVILAERGVDGLVRVVGQVADVDQGVHVQEHVAAVPQDGAEDGLLGGLRVEEAAHPRLPIEQPLQMYTQLIRPFSSGTWAIWLG
jgi:hypothetical protein